jgi:hypothetical protein
VQASIRFIVTFPPSGVADQVARIIGQETSVILNTPTLVENKASEFIAAVRQRWLTLIRQLGIKAE